MCYPSLLVPHHWSLNHNDQQKHSMNTTTSLDFILGGSLPKVTLIILNLTGVALSTCFSPWSRTLQESPAATPAGYDDLQLQLEDRCKIKIMAILTIFFVVRMTFSFAWWSIEGWSNYCQCWGEENKTHIEWWFICLCGTWDEILTELSSHRSKLHLIFCKVEEDEFDEESLPDPIPTLGKKRRQFWQDLVILGDAQNCHVWAFFNFVVVPEVFLWGQSRWSVEKRDDALRMSSATVSLRNDFLEQYGFEEIDRPQRIRTPTGSET